MSSMTAKLIRLEGHGLAQAGYCMDFCLWSHTTQLMTFACRKGQATNEMLFGGVSLGASGAESLDSMKEQAEKGITVE
jgi:hypothetical protein